MELQRQLSQENSDASASIRVQVTRHIDDDEEEDMMSIGEDSPRVSSDRAHRDTAGKAKRTNMKKRKKLTDTSGSKQVKRPHFKIEWRELSYYYKQGSLLDRLVDKFTFNCSKSEATQNHHQSRASLFSSKRREQQPSKRILNSLDGCFRSGELSAILGPSGAGKSTFLATLFGSKQENSQGQTRVTWFCDKTGQPIDLPGRRAIKIASLPQHDHLLNHLTVYESLMFASKIKNADERRNSYSFHRANVKRVAKMLNLTDCLDTRCGKLSGGQYKRVSIGQELLSEPDVIILDEPTSGLDAMTCLTTIQTLKSIVTKHPMSIILTIHQPDIDVFNLFDHVYVIAQGGLAIYEGPPQGIVDALAAVQLQTPSANYNPARFIVEHAFLEEPPDLLTSGGQVTGLPQVNENPSGGSSDDDEEESLSDENEKAVGAKEYLRRSVLSLTEIISGKEMASGDVGDKLGSSTLAQQDKRPLLNIGIQTLDGKLITSDQLARSEQQEQWRSARLVLLKRLNQNQKARYINKPLFPQQPQSGDSARCSPMSGASISHEEQAIGPAKDLSLEGANSDYASRSSGRWSATGIVCAGGLQQLAHKAASLVDLQQRHSPDNQRRSLQMIDMTGTESVLTCDDDYDDDDGGAAGQWCSSTSSSHASAADKHDLQVDDTMGKTRRMRRQFDKRLSAKHNCSRQRGQPIWYHTFLLTHRTWLSIVRDPIFFGIQATMHTIIPVLLALIFGSTQEEGCPRVGNFDLVEFAYSDSANMIQGTVSSIRQSIGNIGIVFFEMFVLSFSINCITALVFPLDMYVLLKEYRNGWYSLRSYLFGRTLADLPVPVVLHSLAMAILCYLTGQPLSLWRFGAIVGLVILASLVAQSVGLTIGALLMKSSQSAVLAAAGIVAPFFALSGFIVRIHTLPLVAQLAAKLSYLYYLLNGFIILRYGFGRCACSADDFELNKSHEIPSNLHTMASMWIGTYSDEYADSAAVLSQNKANRTNVDPNIDVVDKMLQAFKMANSYGHQISNCTDVVPYAMLDFNLRDQDIYVCFLILSVMLIISRFVTFGAIYYKVRSYT